MQPEKDLFEKYARAVHFVALKPEEKNAIRARLMEHMKKPKAVPASITAEAEAKPDLLVRFARAVRRLFVRA